jgi:hypothetical protein
MTSLADCTMHATRMFFLDTKNGILTTIKTTKIFFLDGEH